MNYSEKMKEISDAFTQQIDSLKIVQQAMKTEMEKQQRENQMSTAEISEKHYEELEALEESYSLKLITEHERFQDLQRESERMQEDFEKELKDVEEN